MYSLAKTVIERAIETGTVIATAESCTGGMIAGALTDIAGSSAAFDRGFVTYSNEAKAELLGVPIEYTQDPGAVSSLVAKEMALGALERSNANLSVSVTGIAGPGGGSAEKPVGLVYIGVGKTAEEPLIERCIFTDNGAQISRTEVREATVRKALDMLLAAITRA